MKRKHLDEKCMKFLREIEKETGKAFSLKVTELGKISRDFGDYCTRNFRIIPDRNIPKLHKTILAGFSEKYSAKEYLFGDEYPDSCKLEIALNEELKKTNCRGQYEVNHKGILFKRISGKERKQKNSTVMRHSNYWDSENKVKIYPEYGDFYEELWMRVAYFEYELLK